MGGQGHALAHVWKSEDKSVDSFLWKSNSGLYSKYFLPTELL